MSGNVNARVPISGLLFASASMVGLDRVGNFARALPVGIPPVVPDLLNCDGDWWKFVVADGEICHVDGGTGGVSLPDVDLLRLAEGGVPIANCTLGGEIELISRLQLLLRRFDCFMLIGWERGIPLGAVVHCCK